MSFFSTEVTVNNGQTNLCVKERGDAESGIRNLSVVEDDIISNTNDINSFFIPNKSKYIGRDKKNKHDSYFTPSESEIQDFDSCSRGSGKFFGMSIPEFSPATSNDYYENVFENKNLNCYNFNDKIPNLNSSLVDDNKCDKIVDNNSRFLGGFGYVALYQKDNEYQGLNFNSKDIILDNEYSSDILQMREHMLFWYKTYDDNDKKFISRSATVNGREFTKIQQGYNNQKEYILKDYSGNENHATLSYIDYLGNYIVNKESTKITI